MMSHLDQVIDFVLEHWPPHRAPLIGASDADLARLESLQKRPLPDDYRTLLKRLGHSVHGLKWDHIDFRLEPTVRFLERMGNDLRFLQGRYMLVGRDLTESNLEFLLDLEGSAEGGIPVVRTSVFSLSEALTPDDVNPDATSLAELLFREAYLDLRREPLPQSSLHVSMDFSGRLDERELVERVLVGLGLARHPLSGPWFQAFETHERLVVVRWLKGRTLQLITASTDESWVSGVGEALERRLPLRLR